MLMFSFTLVFFYVFTFFYGLSIIAFIYFVIELYNHSLFAMLVRLVRERYIYKLWVHCILLFNSDCFVNICQWEVSFKPNYVNPSGFLRDCFGF